MIGLLLKGMSPQVFELSVALYLCLLASFKAHLKVQLEVFFKDIFLPVLETSASSFQHKWLVMQAISRICADPQTLVDLYVNYDCDLALSNVFETVVNDVSKIAMGRHAVDLGVTPGTGQLEGHAESMKVLGLECLSRCLASLVEWVTRPDQEAAGIDAASQDRLSTDVLSEAPSFTDQGCVVVAECILVQQASSLVLFSNHYRPDEVLALKKKKEVYSTVSLRRDSAGM